MGFAEEAEQTLINLMVKNRHGAFSRLEKSNQGETVVIKFLSRLGEPTSPKHLAESLNLSSARIAVILGSLEKKQMIARNMDPHDRRRISVTLTDCGKEVAKSEKKEMHDKMIKIFNLMGETDTKKLVELIATFIDYSHKITPKEEGDQQ